MMPPTSFFVVVFGALLVPTLSQNVAHPIVLYAEYPVVTTCGGILTSNYSAIAYKTEIYVNPNERCVWTISTPNATGYTLDVLSLGLTLQTGQTGIIATCVSQLSANNFTSVAITGRGVVRLPTTCHKLLITFYSGAIVSSRGFIIWYNATSGQNSISSNSKDYIFSKSQQQVRHPSDSNSNYANNELSIFVFGTPSNLYDSTRKTLVIYVRDRLQGSGCWDKLQIYFFRPARGWIMADQVCGETESDQWADNDLILLTFKSDSTAVNRGFHISRSTVYNKFGIDFEKKA